jgi:hypothetical protein
MDFNAVNQEENAIPSPGSEWDDSLHLQKKITPKNYFQIMKRKELGNLVS